MKVLVAGAGAMGSCFGHMLHKGGHQVTLCDTWDENINTVNKEGLKIFDVDHFEESPLKMYYPNQVPDYDYDLVLLFTKSHYLTKLVEQIKHLVKDHTKVLCCLNGLGHLQTLRKYFNDKNLLMAVTVVTAKTLAPGQFLISAHSLTEVQNIDPNERAACEAVVDAFNKSGMPFKYSENIAFSIWRKAILNGVANSVCALLDVNMVTLGRMPNAQAVVKQLVDEFVLAASLEGVELDNQEMFDYVWYFLTPKFPGHMHYPSMHQDLVTHQRKTEIEFLNGYVARVTREAGKWAPYCELITAFVQTKEVALGIVHQ